MSDVSQSLSTTILAIMYFGDVVFAVSGALTAARRRLDIIGFVLIGAMTEDLFSHSCIVWKRDRFQQLGQRRCIPHHQMRQLMRPQTQNLFRFKI